MYNLLIPILATCFINAETQPDKQVAMNNKPRLAYIYAIDSNNGIVYASFNGPIKEETKQVDITKLNKVQEAKCAPLLKGDIK